MLGQGDGRSDVREVGQSLREVSQHLAVFVSRDMTGPVTVDGRTLLVSVLPTLQIPP